MKLSWAFSFSVVGFALAAATQNEIYEPEFPGKFTFGDGSAVPPIAQSFAPLQEQVGISWDENLLFLESGGLPEHEMMTGITAWQQQIPIPHDFTGKHAFRIPLNPEASETPGELTLKGPLAIAVNGIPIFHALTQSGKDAYAAGELDRWGGHCGRADDYHYHIAPAHLEEIVGKGNPVAWSLDGYPIVIEDPENPVELDEYHGYVDKNGQFRYVGNLEPPYVMSYFRGPVDLESRPRTQGIRPHLQPLRGAEITGFEGSLQDGFLLRYAVNGRESQIRYTVNGETGVNVEFIDKNGRSRNETYVRRDGKDRRPPPPRRR